MVRIVITLMTVLISGINCLDKITINQPQQSITLGEGDMLVLHLIAKGPGSDNFIYEWRKKGIDDSPDSVRENTQNLTIRSVMPSDSGSYYCNVMNQWGRLVKSKNTIVNVLCECLLHRCTSNISDSYTICYSMNDYYGMIIYFDVLALIRFVNLINILLF